MKSEIAYYKKLIGLLNANGIAANATIDYVKGVLKPLKQAMDEGIDVRGYYLWSLMDNFEWSAGYEARYGVYYTNYETLERIPKNSAKWYAKVIAEHGFEE